jgi:hypothetical protein
LSKHITQFCGFSSFSGQDILGFFDFLGNDFRSLSPAILFQIFPASRNSAGTSHRASTAQFFLHAIYSRVISRNQSKTQFLTNRITAFSNEKTIAFAFGNFSTAF